KASRVGKVMRLPDPTIVLMVPAAIPAPKTATCSSPVTACCRPFLDVGAPAGCPTRCGHGTPSGGAGRVWRILPALRRKFDAALPGVGQAGLEEPPSGGDHPVADCRLDAVPQPSARPRPGPHRAGQAGLFGVAEQLVVAKPGHLLHQVRMHASPSFGSLVRL